MEITDRLQMYYNHALQNGINGMTVDFRPDSNTNRTTCKIL